MEMAYLLKLLFLLRYYHLFFKSITLNNNVGAVSSMHSLHGYRQGIHAYTASSRQTYLAYHHLKKFGKDHGREKSKKFFFNTIRFLAGFTLT